MVEHARIIAEKTDDDITYGCECGWVGGTHERTAAGRRAGRAEFDAHANGGVVRSPAPRKSAAGRKRRPPGKRKRRKFKPVDPDTIEPGAIVQLVRGTSTRAVLKKDLFKVMGVTEDRVYGPSLQLYGPVVRDEDEWLGKATAMARCFPAKDCREVRHA